MKQRRALGNTKFPVQTEDFQFMNIYAPDNLVTIFIKQKSCKLSWEIEMP